MTPKEQAIALRRVQYQGHKAIDAVYRDMQRDIDRAVARSVVKINNRTQVPAARGLILQSEIDRIVGSYTPRLAQVVQATAREAAALTGATADVGMVGVLTRLDQGRRRILGRIAPFVDDAVSGAYTGRQMRTMIGKFFNPFYAPRRGAKGKLVQSGRRRMDDPLVAGSGSYDVRRLMMTESTAAHGRAARLAAVRQGHLIQWVLSPLHIQADVCDPAATRDVGWGPGIMEPENVPDFPSHPNCLCVLAVVDRATLTYDPTRGGRLL